MKHTTAVSGLQVRHKSLGRRILDHWQIYLLLLPAVIYFIIFYYWPMAGLQIAFRDYRVSKGIWGSTWVGLKYFQKFFQHPQCWKIIRNTMVISLYTLATFPLSIIMALLINELRGKKFQKTVQMVTYAPHFISNVVMVSMLSLMLAKGSGVVNGIFRNMGLEAVDFLGKPALFKHLYVWSDVWQHNGWQAIIYIATLSSVPPELYEAAVIDGAGKLQRIRYIDIQALLPTATILLIMSCGNIMNISFEKIYLMQNSMNISASEVISTYVYKAAFAEGKYDYSTAINLFSSVVNFALLISVNLVARKLSDTSLF